MASSERARPVCDKGGHVLRNTRGEDAGVVWQSTGAMQAFELIGIDCSYIAGVLASLRKREVCRVVLNAQATITVASEHTCVTLKYLCTTIPSQYKP
jgi:hypothetical protein